MTIVRRSGPLLRQIKTPRGLTPMQDVLEEMDTYVRIMAGDDPAPFDNGVLTLHEAANAYYGRAREVEGLIYRGERSGEIPKASAWAKFRTGELQSYLALFRHADELGSRRLTAAVEFRDDPLD